MVSGTNKKNASEGLTQQPKSFALKKKSHPQVFYKAYGALALFVLLATTIFWSVIGAHLQSGNADQLVNTYLFQHSDTFKAATFPGQHSLLLKWPLFLLIKLFGASAATFTVFTVSVSLLTVLFLAALIYKINKKPLIFGTIYLGLASVLLLVPTLPYAGGLLPVNMAMITTRNIEYAIYIISLMLIIKSPRLKSWGFGLAIGLMSLLIASDKLFLILGVGGALMALVVYAVVRSWNLVSLSVNWLIANLAAALVALGLLGLINSASITHISAQSSGPYGLVHGFHDLVLGIVYSLLGLLTNLGSNPAFGTTVLRGIPHQLHINLLGIHGLSFIVNLAILAGGLLVVYRLTKSSLRSSESKANKLNNPSLLAIMLVWTALASFVVFILTSHDYAVDARYLTISLFALFISIAVFADKRQWNPNKVMVVGLVFAVSVLVGVSTAVRAYHSDTAGLATVNDRNYLVAQALARHPVNVLVGDYWRVVPTKLAAGNKINIMPQESCSKTRTILSSKSWQLDLNNHGFAYLLTLDQSLTDYKNCTLDQVISNYGRPNASVLIAGNLSQPKELLLFYDNGIRKSAPTTPQLTKNPATVLPISVDEVPYTSCPVPTIMNIVAHEDDDLLFMNPDLIHDIKGTHCIRTVYVTAGDAGSNRFYWLDRERGSEAAYSSMIGSKEIWVQRIVKLSDKAYITIANPRGNSQISLIFMHLHDGNLNGQGFSSSHYESLAKLYANGISSISSVDNQSSYTSAQLTAALTTLMHLYQPIEVRTQSNYPGHQYIDHSDHMAVGRYVQKAYTQYEKQQYEDKVMVPIEFYIGYPIHQMPENVSGADLKEKEATFLAYAHYDGGVCQSLKQCLTNPAYSSYLKRQYKNSN